MFYHLLFKITVVIILVINFSIEAQKKIHIYNWSDYIAEDTLSDFEKNTGIKVIYDVFDSNEILEGKMMAGNTGYNIVFPSSSFLAKQLDFGIFQPIDKKKLTNYKNLDNKLMKKLEEHDPFNKYSIPYLWATTGIGFNTEKIKKVLGNNVPLNSWELIFNPENLKKLSTCGVSFLDAPEEIFATVLNYLGKDPNSKNEQDYSQLANNLLLELRPYIRYFHSSHYINDLSNGNICIAIGWAGDILQAKNFISKLNKNNNNKNNINISYIIPKEGALTFFDMIAIPKDADNIDETHQFINYLLEPSVIAKISNKTFYANANKKSFSLINSEIRNNTGIYPSKNIMSKLFILKVQDIKIDRIRTKLWNKIKLNKFYKK